MRSSPRTTPTRARLGGTAAVLAGLCYAAAGYFYSPGISGYTGALVSVLSVAFPALFLGGLLGLQARLPHAAQTGFVSSAGFVGFVSGCFGAVLGIANALGLGGTIASALRLEGTAIPFFKKTQEILEELDLLESRLEAAEVEHIAVREAARREKERAEKLQAALEAERAGRRGEQPGP